MFRDRAKSAAQHFLVTGEVIWPLDRLDLKAAILAGLWPARLKDHHRPYRVRALRIRDIVTLDALWRGREIERFL